MLTDEAFFEKLEGSPVLQNLAVTPAQTLAAKRLSFWLVAGAALAAVLAAGFIAVNPLQYFASIAPDSALGQLGLTGSPLAIRELYVYGGETRAYYSRTDARLDAQAYLADDTKGSVLLLQETGEEIPVSEALVEDVSDFAQLKNLEALCLTKSEISDLSPLYGLSKLRLLDVSYSGVSDISGIAALSALETLNLADTEVEDLTPLLECGALKTLVLSPMMAGAAEALGDAPFQIEYTAVRAASYEELRRAALDASVFTIFLTADVTIPAGETVVIRAGVQLKGVDISLTNEGTLEILGIVEMGMAERINRGAVLVRPGGLYTGGMGSSVNMGEFVVEPGGTFILERGEAFGQQSGAFQNAGTTMLRDGGCFLFRGGALENTGLFDYSAKSQGAAATFEGNPAAVTGGGMFLVPEEAIKR